MTPHLINFLSKGSLQILARKDQEKDLHSHIKWKAMPTFFLNPRISHTEQSYRSPAASEEAYEILFATKFYYPAQASHLFLVLVLYSSFRPNVLTKNITPPSAARG